MKVLYLTQVFETDNDPGSDRHFYFCKQLVRNGHEAVAITSNVDYKKAQPRTCGKDKIVFRQVNGVDIYYVYSFAGFRGSFFKRIIYYLTYLATALWQGCKVTRPDVIYAVSTPLTVGLLGYCLSRIKRVPFVFEVTDVWPDAAVACGVLRNPVLIWLARRLERFCYRKAEHVVALTEGIRQNIIGKAVPSEKVSLVTNGIDPDLFCRREEPDRRSEVRTQLGIAEKFVSLYLGAHGAYNALDTIVDTAEALSSDPRFAFVFVGDGDEKRRLQESVENRRLSNVLFLPSVPRSEAPGILQAADCFLLPNRRGEFFLGNLPNKLFDFLGSGRPIVVAGEGESAELIRKAGCGRVVDAEDEVAMAAAIRELSKIPDEERESMGKSGSQFVLKNFDRSLLARKLESILENVALLRKKIGFSKPWKDISER